MSSVQYESSILEEECNFHKQVEWVIKFNWKGMLQGHSLRATSPEFKIGSQLYKLELSSDSFYWANLLLYRKGPSVDGPSRFQWWAGLKNSRDGTYNDRNLKGDLELKEKYETWTHITLCRISNYELKDYFHYSVPHQILIVFFRLSLERALATTEECTHGAAKMSAQGTGTIREEECTSHKHVEWEVEFDRLQKRRNLMSPSFVIGTRDYKLELSFGFCRARMKTIHVHLHSKESPDVGPSRFSRWWAGMKLSDGRCVRGSNGRGTLDLKKESEVWTQKSLYTMKEDELEVLDNDQKHHLVVFFRLSFEEASRTAKMCDHVSVVMPFPGSHGTIQEEECSSYKHVEWKISMDYYSILGHRDLISPEFATGLQCHKLEFCMQYPNQLHLYSKGPSVHPSRTARWWAGFKRSDGTCILAINSGIMDLQEFCELWTQKFLYSIFRHEIDNVFENRQLTIFFRMSVHQASAVTEVCTGGTIEMAVQGEGSIQDVDYTSHKEVEWNITVCELNPGVWSPTFPIEGQQFKFQYCWPNNVKSLFPIRLRLYSRSCSVVGPCRSLHWCMGLKFIDGTYLHKILRGELKEAYELWTLIGFVDFTLADYVRMKHTFFLRLKWETAPVAEKACIHGAVEGLAEGYGEIRRQEFPSHEQVDWTINYERLCTEDQNFSPEFLIGTQRYILELSVDLKTLDSMTLCLYRRGSSVAEPSRFVRWWAGLKRGNGIYRLRNQRGELDLTEECELWTQIYLQRVCRYELERELLAPDHSLTIFFRLSMERTATTCTHAGVEAVQKIKRLSNESNCDVVFQVKGVKFRMPRAILEARIPVFKAMFHHDTVENATGVVTIKDFKPAIFEEFLHYISAGFLHELTVHNAFSLYAIADKYLVDDLKAECLQCLSDTLSVDSFCDVVTLAIRHREDDLMKEATDFFSRNRNITTTDSWKKFSADNPAEAIDLLTVFPPQEKKERKVNKKKRNVNKKKQKAKKGKK